MAMPRSNVTAEGHGRGKGRVPNLNRVRWLLWLPLMAAVGCATVQRAPENVRVHVRVMTVVMAEGGPDPTKWTGEGKWWVQNDKMTRRVVVPGLTEPVLCNASGQCLMVTGVGPVEAAASIMAVGVSPELDLRRTYFLVAGIAGVSPEVGALGSVAWAEWVVSADSKSEIDIRELPPKFEFSGFRMLCQEPWCDGWPGEVGAYHLNPTLKEWAFRLSHNVQLTDSDAAKSYRSEYPADSAARSAPSVLKGDVLAGSAWWHGAILGRWAEWWVKQWTKGAGHYCMTSNEDFAIVATLARLAKEGRVDSGRVMVLRAASNFDRPYPGQQALQSLLPVKGGYPLALENAYRVGSVVAHYILTNWQGWKGGVPPLDQSPGRSQD
jgi:purine nucleoside permease